MKHLIYLLMCFLCFCSCGTKVDKNDKSKTDAKDTIKTKMTSVHFANFLVINTSSETIKGDTIQYSDGTNNLKVGGQILPGTSKPSDKSPGSSTSTGNLMKLTVYGSDIKIGDTAKPIKLDNGNTVSAILRYNDSDIWALDIAPKGTSSVREKTKDMLLVNLTNVEISVNQLIYQDGTSRTPPPLFTAGRINLYSLDLDPSGGTKALKSIIYSIPYGSNIRILDIPDTPSLQSKEIKHPDEIEKFFGNYVIGVEITNSDGSIKNE